MSIYINEKIVSEIFDDAPFERDLLTFLHQSIDFEIKKGDDLNDLAVKDYIDTIILIEKGSTDIDADELMSPDDVMSYLHRKNGKSKRIRKAVLIAIIIVLAANFTAYWVVPAYAESVDSVIEQITELFDGGSYKGNESSK